MQLTSAEVSKLLKKLKSEYESLLLLEKESATFMASVGEDKEDCRPEYDYEKTKKEIADKECQIRKVRHALNVFNAKTVIPEYKITIDEMLMLIPQLNSRKEKLTEMSRRSPKMRTTDTGFVKSSVIDYIYTNYDRNSVTKDLSVVTDELSKAQLALDSIKHREALEIEL